MSTGSSLFSKSTGPLGPLFYRRIRRGEVIVVPRARRDAKTEAQTYRRSYFSYMVKLASKLYLPLLKRYSTYWHVHATAISDFVRWNVPERYHYYSTDELFISNGTLPKLTAVDVWILPPGNRFGFVWNPADIVDRRESDVIRIVMVKRSPFFLWISPELDAAAGFCEFPAYPSDIEYPTFVFSYMLARFDVNGLPLTSAGSSQEYYLSFD